MTLVQDKKQLYNEQEKTFRIQLPGGLYLELVDNWANRRGAMIFLRSLRDGAGKPVMTYRQIARAMGYADRRNVHNYWMAFEACDSDLLEYLSRKKKVDSQVVEVCEQIWQLHPFLSPAEVLEEVRRRLPEKGESLTVENIRTAGSQVGFLRVQQALRRQLAEGEAHYKEEGLIERLFEMLLSRDEDCEEPAVPIPEELERVAPRGPSKPVEGEKVAQLEEQLLEGETSPGALASLWAGPVGMMMLAYLLYYHGLSLGVLGQWFGVHKTTVMRRLEPFAQLNWQRVVQGGKRFFSGRVAVDEKWVKIEGVWWFLFAAVDCVSGLPLHMAYFPSNKGVYCRLFLSQLKQLGYIPKVIITDGWDGYLKAIAQVFPGAEHLLCRFHALRAAYRRLKKSLSDWSEQRRWAGRLSRLFQTKDKRTGRRRAAKLQGEAADTPVAGVIDRLVGKLPQLLPAVGSRVRPATINAAEQFFAPLDRFFRLKGPFQSQASAEKHLALFLLGYLFTIQSSDQAEYDGLCPLQRAGYQVAEIPLFHLLNRPDLSRLRDQLVQRYAMVA